MDYTQIQIDEAITVLSSRRDEHTNQANMLDIAISQLKGLYPAKLQELEDTKDLLVTEVAKSTQLQKDLDDANAKLPPADPVPGIDI